MGTEERRHGSTLKDGLPRKFTLSVLGEKSGDRRPVNRPLREGAERADLLQSPHLRAARVETRDGGPVSPDQSVWQDASVG